MCSFLHSFTVRLLFCVFLGFGVSAVNAQSNDFKIRSYVGGGLSIGQFNLDDCGREAQTQIISIAGYDFENQLEAISCDPSAGFNFFTGTEVDEYFALELGFISFDEIFKVGDTSTGINSAYLAGIGRLPIPTETGGSALTVRVGGHYWEGDHTVDRSTDLLYGIGADFGFTENFRGQITLTRYVTGDEDDNNIHVLATNFIIMID